MGITDLGIAGACQDGPKDSPLGISYNQDPEEPEDTRVCAHCVTHCSLDDQVLRDTADIKQSQKNQSQRCHTFKLPSKQSQSPS